MCVAFCQSPARRFSAAVIMKGYLTFHAKQFLIYLKPYLLSVTERRAHKFCLMFFWKNAMTVIYRTEKEKWRRAFCRNQSAQPALHRALRRSGGRKRPGMSEQAVFTSSMPHIPQLHGGRRLRTTRTDSVRAQSVFFLQQKAFVLFFSKHMRVTRNHESFFLTTSNYEILVFLKLNILDCNVQVVYVIK